MNENSSFLGSLMAKMVKNLSAVQEPGFDPWVGKIPCRKEWQPTPVFLLGEFHGQGLQPMGSQRVGQTERLTLSLSCQFCFLDQYCF